MGLFEGFSSVCPLVYTGPMRPATIVGCGRLQDRSTRRGLTHLSTSSAHGLPNQAFAPIYSMRHFLEFRFRPIAGHRPMSHQAEGLRSEKNLEERNGDAHHGIVDHWRMAWVQVGPEGGT